MLCSSSSSIHRGGTPACRAAAKRSWSSGTWPAATAAANRTSAAVAGSRGSVILLLPRAGPSILLLLEPPIYAQLADGLAARVHHGPGGERHRSWPEPELLQHGGHRERRRHGMAVGDLDGHPQSVPRQHRAVDALRTDLDDQPSGMRAHHVGTGPADAGDELGVAEHGFNNAECGMRNAEW